MRSNPKLTKRRRGLVIFGFALAVAVAVVVVGVTRPSPPLVRVVGDSITAFAGRDVTAALGTSYRAEIQAGIGRRIDEMLPTIRDSVRGHPFAVFVDLGTNDARQAQSHPDWRRGFELMIGLLGPERCVLVATVSTLVDGSVGAAQVASAINVGIAAAVAAHPNFHPIDWNAAVHGPNGVSLLVADKVHPSAAGQLTLAAMVRSTLDRDCHDR